MSALEKYTFADTCQVICFKISHYSSQLGVNLKSFGNFLSVFTTKKFNNSENMKKKNRLTNASQFLFVIVVFDLVLEQSLNYFTMYEPSLNFPP